MRARQGLAALLLLAGLPGVVHANKKSSGAASAAQWAAKAEAATVAVGTPLVGSGQAAAGPTASASELAAVEAPATTGPGARVGYLKLMPTPLTAIDPEVSCLPNAEARMRCWARNPSLVPLTELTPRALAAAGCLQRAAPPAARAALLPRAVVAVFHTPSSPLTAPPRT